MKITVTSIGVVSTTEGFINARVICSGEDLNIKDLHSALQCALDCADRYLYCTMSDTISTKKDGNSYGLTIKFPRDKSVWNILYDFSNKKGLSLHLLVQEKVDAELFSEATRLLDDLCSRTGYEKANVLAELTTFRSFKGKKDLIFVSAKQLPVIIDKMKQLLFKTEDHLSHEQVSNRQ